jgi:uncharacterized membrane protein YuzA (DUF378 family)
LAYKRQNFTIFQIDVIFAMKGEPVKRFFVGIILVGLIALDLLTNAFTAQPILGRVILAVAAICLAYLAFSKRKEEKPRSSRRPRANRSRSWLGD